MSKFYKISIIAIIILQFAVAALYLLQGNLIFHTDIARDFLLLAEIAEKKLILIGPRASGLDGLFHGPLWLYLNYPAYLIGNGNPIVVGWWWLMLTAIFLISVYFIAKKFSNEKVGYLSLLFCSNLLVPAAKGFFNPYGAMFIFPLFFFCLLLYKRRNSFGYLLLTLFLAGLLVQFQLAFGLPILFLTVIFTGYKIIKSKKYIYLTAYLILLIPLSTFILFDIRHGFSQTQSVINYFAGNIKYEKISLWKMITSRFDVIFNSILDIGRGNLGQINFLASIFLTLFIFRNRKDYFVLFSYLLIGFMLLSFTHNGWLLYYYFSPFIPLAIIILCMAVIESKNTLVYFVTSAVMFLSAILIITGMFGELKKNNNDLSSWKFLNHLTKTVFDEAPAKFGLYIYTPDVLAYQAKYAITYGQKTHPDKQMTFSQKQSVTYILEEPPPKDRPEMDGRWWIKERIKINKSPDKIIRFSNGYQIKKYLLTEDEIKTPSDPLIADWITMR